MTVAQTKSARRRIRHANRHKRRAPVKDLAKEAKPKGKKR